MIGLDFGGTLNLSLLYHIYYIGMFMPNTWVAVQTISLLPPSSVGVIRLGISLNQQRLGPRFTQNSLHLILCSLPICKTIIGRYASSVIAQAMAFVTGWTRCKSYEVDRLLENLAYSYMNEYVVMNVEFYTSCPECRPYVTGSI